MSAREPRELSLDDRLDEAVREAHRAQDFVADYIREAVRDAGFVLVPADALPSEEDASAVDQAVSFIKGRNLSDGAAEFAKARSLLGERVRVVLDLQDPVIVTTGVLLSIEDTGEIVTVDETGAVSYSWPMLKIEAAPLGGTE